MLLLAGSQGLREILRGNGNPVEKMNDRDVKPILQQALTTPGGWKVVDLEDPEVPDACIIEGDRTTGVAVQTSITTIYIPCDCLQCNLCEYDYTVMIKHVVH